MNFSANNENSPRSSILSTDIMLSISSDAIFSGFAFFSRKVLETYFQTTLVTQTQWNAMKTVKSAIKLIEKFHKSHIY